jgi:tetratricopeptide (TPR) repeat protein
MNYTVQLRHGAAMIATFVLALLLGNATGQGDDREAALRLLSGARDILAAATAESFEGKIYRGDALGDVAAGFASLGDVNSANEAISIIKKDPDADVCAQRAAMQVALADARRGNVAEALRSVDTIKGGWNMLGRREIAKLQAANGDIPGAIQTCEGVTVNRRRASQYLTEVASIALSAGDRNGAQVALGAALKVLDKPLEAIDEIDALEEIAIGYSRLGENEKSQSIFRRLTDRAKQSRRLSDWAGTIAAAFADAGFFDDALRMAAKVDPQETDFFTGGRAVDTTYGLIGVAAARRRQWDVACNVAERIERGSIKARVLARVSTALWQARKESESNSAYRDATVLLHESKEEASDSEIILACDALVEVKLIRGEFTDAVAITQQMPRTGARGDVLRKIAQAQVAVGNLPDALTTAKAIDHVDHRATAYQTIVAAEARSGGTSIFDRLMESEEDPIVRARMMVARAAALQSVAPTPSARDER